MAVVSFILYLWSVVKMPQFVDVFILNKFIRELLQKLRVQLVATIAITFNNKKIFEKVQSVQDYRIIIII